MTTFLDQSQHVASRFYEAVFDDGAWSEAVVGLRQLLESEHAALGFIDYSTLRQTLLHGDCSYEFERLYFEVFETDPMTPRIRTLADRRPLVDEQVVARAEWERSDFYNLWLRPQNQHSTMAIKLTSHETVGSYLMLNRGGRAEKYGRADMERLNRVSASVAHAIDLRVRFGRKQLEDNGRLFDRRGVAFLALDPRGYLAWMNDAAETMLSRPGSAVSAGQGRLKLHRQDQMRQFLKHVYLAANADPALRRGSDMLAVNADTGHAVTLSIIPAHNLLVQGLSALHGCYIAVQDLTDRLPPGFEDRMRSLFDLTPREADLAAALVSGLALQSVAASRGISMPTARTHLAQVFRKTGTQQQSQLVSLLLSAVPPWFVS